MSTLKKYVKNLIGVDLIIIAMYLSIFTVVGAVNEELTPWSALEAAFLPISVILISTVIIATAMYIIDEI